MTPVPNYRAREFLQEVNNIRTATIRGATGSALAALDILEARMMATFDLEPVRETVS